MAGKEWEGRDWAPGPITRARHRARGMASEMQEVGFLEEGRPDMVLLRSDDLASCASRGENNCPGWLGRAITTNLDDKERLCDYNRLGSAPASLRILPGGEISQRL